MMYEIDSTAVLLLLNKRLLSIMTGRVRYTLRVSLFFFTVGDVWLGSIEASWEARFVIDVILRAPFETCVDE